MINISATKNHELLAALNEEVQTLHHELHPAIFKPYDKAGITSVLQTFINDPACRAYVAYEHNVPVGYIIFFIRETEATPFKYPEQYLYIDQVGVLKAYRGKGIAAQLLAIAESFAVEQGLSRIALDHWSANTTAANYFRKKGYKVYRELLEKDTGL